MSSTAIHPVILDDSHRGPDAPEPTEGQQKRAALINEGLYPATKQPMDDEWRTEDPEMLDDLIHTDPPKVQILGVIEGGLENRIVDENTVVTEQVTVRGERVNF